MLNLPAAPTILGVILFALLLLYWLLRDRSPMVSLQEEVAALRKAMGAQAERHAAQIGALNAKLDLITKQYDEQRSIKHKALNDVAKTVMALDLVQRLAAECTCGALDPLKEIVDRLVADLSTFTRSDQGEPT